jgi:hypothetical protein
MSITGVAYCFRDIGSKREFRNIFPEKGVPAAGGLPSFYTKGNDDRIRQIFQKKLTGWTTHVAVATWGWKGKDLPSSKYVLSEKELTRQVRALMDQSRGTLTKVAISKGIIGMSGLVGRILEADEARIVADPRISVPGFRRVTPDVASGLDGAQVPMPRIRIPIRDR